MDCWPDVTPQIAFSSKGKVFERLVKEENFSLKIRLFGFPDMLVSRSALTAARKVISSSTLIGPFEPNQALTIRPFTGGKRTFGRKSGVTLGLQRASF